MRMTQRGRGLVGPEVESGTGRYPVLKDAIKRRQDDLYVHLEVRYQ